MRLFRSRAKTGARDASRIDADRDLFAEIDRLMRLNRERRDPDLERRLLRVRHEAFERLDRSSPPAPSPPATELVSSSEAVPTVSPRELSVETVSGAVRANGCLHVRGLIASSQAEAFARGIDQAFAACDVYEDGAESDLEGWYEPFKPLPGWKPGGGRKWNRDGGAIWAADSPKLMFELLDRFEELGIRELVTGYLGERPALSMNKSVLRRVSPSSSGGADWHQDGAFLGEGTRSLNVWLSLSHCGRDAPGMDVVPRRLDEIVETGTEGANFPWSVSPSLVEQVAGDVGVARPIFEPGDALLFDHYFLHRTASDPEMTRDRYAIETWFFAPSAYPDKQVPLVF